MTFVETIGDIFKKRPVKVGVSLLPPEGKVLESTYYEISNSGLEGRTVVEIGSDDLIGQDGSGVFYRGNRSTYDKVTEFRHALVTGVLAKMREEKRLPVDGEQKSEILSLWNSWLAWLEPETIATLYSLPKGGVPVNNAGQTQKALFETESNFARNRNLPLSLGIGNSDEFSEGLNLSEKDVVVIAVYRLYFLGILAPDSEETPSGLRVATISDLANLTPLSETDLDRQICGCLPRIGIYHKEALSRIPDTVLPRIQGITERRGKVIRNKFPNLPSCYSKFFKTLDSFCDYKVGVNRVLFGTNLEEDY